MDIPPGCAPKSARTTLRPVTVFGVSKTSFTAEQAQVEVAKLTAQLNIPDELPISDRRDEIVQAIRDHQVIIVAGETGSGKSTQLPKLCLEAGRGIDGRIGHTQPRRLAARSIAERIAEETKSSLGDGVGFAFRFNDRVKPHTRIKLMTDGILLAEVQRDRLLRQYDTLIIDEAHERSLNIDFILGYLYQLLPRRPDLKLIITSATIDTERFSAHFDDAPVIEVSGRTYPVDVRYREPTGEQSQVEQICDAVNELLPEGNGDILVFLPGERDIRETAEALDDLGLSDVETFPLYARLSSAEQHRVFTSHRGRRIVLATNVAETSVTVPGIRYVIDPGTARISRYSNRTKVQRLPIEAVSQASANQRAGRCGRVGPGVCIRLYSLDDFDSRDEFTEPEIKRTNLASVILQMASLGLGDIATFPFVERPDQRNISDGIQLLEELDALDPDHEGSKKWLTPTGRELAKLPVDPRFGRMILEAADNGALHEVMVITSGLSIQDPRERPQDKQQVADEHHQQHAHESSDFLTLINLWRYLEEQRSDKSNSAFRRQCRREFLNYNRIREWQDIYRQLARTTKDLGYTRSGNRASDDTIHQALLAGLLSQIGLKDQKSVKKQAGAGKGRPMVEYLGARNTKFVIGRGSALSKKLPNWVMAGELMETNRLWARMVAQIDPAWVERLSGHIDKRTYTEPVWDPAQGTATTRERVTLYGIQLAANRRVTVASVNPEMARELFIHHGLVLREWEDDHLFTNHDFYQSNHDLIQDVEELETRARRRDLMVEQQARYQFFDERLPEHISSAAHFNKWWKKKIKDDPDLLKLQITDLVTDTDGIVDETQFPTIWHHNGLELELAYEFDSGSDLDGLSVHVPIEVLNQLQPEPFEWSVPGLRTELITTLARSLPKSTRKALLPMAESVTAVLRELEPNLESDLDSERGGLLNALASALGRRAGTVISPSEFDLTKLPAHLRPTFRVINPERELLAEGKSLPALQELMVERVKASLSNLAQATDSASIERSGIREWDFDDLPRELNVEVETAGITQPILAFPALVDEQDSVAIRLLASEDEQTDAMWTGTRRLLKFCVPSPLRKLDGMISNDTKLQLATTPIQSKVGWYTDVIDCALDEVIASNGGPSWQAAGFEKLADAARAEFGGLLEKLGTDMAGIINNYSEIQRQLDQLSGVTPTNQSLKQSLADANAHLKRLTYPGMLAGVGYDRTAAVDRYLQGIAFRLSTLRDNPKRDLLAAAECVKVETNYRTLVTERGLTPELEQATWMLEELRIAQFAQHLRVKGTDGKASKVSAGRIEKYLAAID